MWISILPRPADRTRGGSFFAIGGPTCTAAGLRRLRWWGDEGGPRTADRLVAAGLVRNARSDGARRTAVCRRRRPADLRRSRQHVRTGDATRPVARGSREGQRAERACRLHRL